MVNTGTTWQHWRVTMATAYPSSRRLRLPHPHILVSRCPTPEDRHQSTHPWRRTTCRSTYRCPVRHFRRRHLRSIHKSPVHQSSRVPLLGSREVITMATYPCHHHPIIHRCLLVAEKFAQVLCYDKKNYQSHVLVYGRPIALLLSWDNIWMRVQGQHSYTMGIQRNLTSVLKFWYERSDFGSCENNNKTIFLRHCIRVRYEQMIMNSIDFQGQRSKVKVTIHV